MKMRWILAAVILMAVGVLAYIFRPSFEVQHDAAPRLMPETSSSSRPAVVYPEMRVVPQLVLPDNPFVKDALVTFKPSGVADVRAVGIRGMIVPHHDVASPLIAELFSRFAARSKVRRIILMSPDHEDRAHGYATTAAACFVTAGRSVCSDRELVRRFTELPFVTDNVELANLEHGVTLPIRFIPTYFPSSTVTPLIISPRLPRQSLDVLAGRLASELDETTLVLASIDFSHYLPWTEGAQYDAITKKMIAARDYEALLSRHSAYLDAPQPLVMLLKLMDGYGADKEEVVRESSAAEILGTPFESNTTYLTMIFWK